eukprot:CCRYP_011383-RA/>CCRYP_011383-RA protein AED:0.06 eAED:0.06 QI:223/1/1/1/0.5/0.33/3/168/335
MKFSFPKLISLSLLIPDAIAYSFEDVSRNLNEGKSYLRGGDIGEVMPGAALVVGHLEIAKDRFEGVGVDESNKDERTRCVYPAEEYVEPDGTIVCKKIYRKKGSVVVIDDCLPDEEKVITTSGQVVCRKKRSAVVIHHCLPDEETVVRASGQVVCRKKRSVVVTHHCLPNEEKVVKANGQIVCRKIKNKGRTVVVPRKGPRKNKITKRTVSNDDGGTVVVGYDDDSHYVVGRKKKTSTKKVVVAVDDDDSGHVFVKPSRREHASRTGGIIVVDDDGVIIRPGPSGGCDDDEDPFHHAITGNGNQLYGSDCTASKRSCMPPMTCQYTGNCQWTCKT